MVQEAGHTRPYVHQRLSRCRRPWRSPPCLRRLRDRHTVGEGWKSDLDPHAGGTRRHRGTEGRGRRGYSRSVPSDLLLFRQAGACQAPSGRMRQHSIKGMGGRPRWQSVTSKVLSGRDIARRAHPRRHVAGAGPLSGRVARCVIQNWSHVLSAPRRAWNRHGNMPARWTSARARAAGSELRRLLAQRDLG